MQITKYYGSLANMQKKYDRYARQDYFKGNTVVEFEEWREASRKTLSFLLGIDKMDSVPLEARVEEVVTLDGGIVREKVVIQTEEDVWMPMYILIPAEFEGEKPRVVLAPPGHQGAGKYSVAGFYEDEDVVEAIKRFNYDYGMQLVKKGYVAVCPDARGFGERRDEALQNDNKKSFMNSTCFHLAHMAEPLGMTVAGLCTWDLMRAIDYIKTRGEWNTENIGCVGFSGGGMQALYLAALDERVAGVCISGYMYGFKDSLQLLNGNCNCNYVPHLWEHFDMGDIASLIAPRPLVVQSCRGDHLNGPRGLHNVYEQLDIIKKAYEVYHKTDLVMHDIHEGVHCWHDENLDDILECLFLHRNTD